MNIELSVPLAARLHRYPEINISEVCERALDAAMRASDFNEYLRRVTLDQVDACTSIADLRALRDEVNKGCPMPWDPEFQRAYALRERQLLIETGSVS